MSIGKYGYERWYWDGDLAWFAEHLAGKAEWPPYNSRVYDPSETRKMQESVSIYASQCWIVISTELWCLYSTPMHPRSGGTPFKIRKFSLIGHDNANG